MLFIITLNEAPGWLDVNVIEKLFDPSNKSPGRKSTEAFIFIGRPVLRSTTLKEDKGPPGPNLS